MIDRQHTINDALWEFCKYQHGLIKMYKEFIEKTILVKIKENERYAPDYCTVGEGDIQEVRVKEIRIPESRFMMLETPNVQRQWEMMNWEMPQVDPEVFLAIMSGAEIKKDRS